MNERISAIAARAGLVATTMIDDSSRDIECYIDTSDGVPSTATIHKFAQLIVKECGEWCGHDPEGVAAMYKHFGVEGEI